MRNPPKFGDVTVSRPFPVDALDGAFLAIRAAHDGGDRDAAKRAWLDLGALLGVSLVESAPPATLKRSRKRSG